MKSTTRRAAARKRRAERNNALRFFAPAFRPMFRQLWRRRICGEMTDRVTLVLLLVRRARPAERWIVVAHGDSYEEAERKIEDWEPEPPSRGRWDCVSVETVVTA